MKLLVAGGGTGGHIYPGLALIQMLKPEEALYVGSERGLEKKLTLAYRIPFRTIQARPLMGQGWIGKFFAVGFTGIGFLQSFGILLKFKPNVVVGTGGYVCAPVLVAAACLRIPSFLLEQNFLPGRTTRFLSRWVSRVLTSFPESEKYLPNAKVTFTGNPVRPEIGSLTKEQGCKMMGIRSDLPTVTFMGASQGAKAINCCLLKSIPQLTDKSWQIIHLTGEKHYSEIMEEKKMISNFGNLRYLPFPFLENMAAVYAASDFVVSRAGATTLAEIMQAGKPSLLIPYPFAADNHQELNARWLEEKNGCQVLLEKDLSPSVLVSLLKSTLDNPKRLEDFSNEAQSAAPKDAMKKIIEAVAEVAR